MGRSSTPKYVIYLSCISFINKRKELHRFAWKYKQHGKPTEKNAKRFRDDMNKSIESGNNTHLNGSQSLYSNAIIKENRFNGVIIAQYTSPMFEVI